MTIEYLIDESREAYEQFGEIRIFNVRKVTSREPFDAYRTLKDDERHIIHSPEDPTLPSLIIPNSELMVRNPKKSKLTKVNMSSVNTVYRLPQGYFELTLINRRTKRVARKISGFNLNE